MTDLRETVALVLREIWHHGANWEAVDPIDLDHQIDRVIAAARPIIEREVIERLRERAERGEYNVCITSPVTGEQEFLEYLTTWL